MKLSTVLTALRESLQTRFGQAISVGIASTPEDSLEALGAAAPRNFRVILLPDGEEAIDEGHGSAGVHTLNVIIQAAAGMSAEKDAALTQANAAGRAPFLDMLEDIREHFRMARWLTNDATPRTPAGLHPHALDFLGWAWVAIEGKPTRQASLRFSFFLAHEPGPDAPVIFPAEGA